MTTNPKLKALLLASGDFIVGEVSIDDLGNSLISKAVYFKLFTNRIEPLRVGGALLQDSNKAIKYNKSAIFAEFDVNEIDPLIVENYENIIKSEATITLEEQSSSENN